jgi:hypothetical protein
MRCVSGEGFGKNQNTFNVAVSLQKSYHLGDDVAKYFRAG